jgi:glucose-6-phosphate isomerase
LYAFLVNINAYHQPGVEAGKQAASAVLAIRKSVIEILKSQQGVPQTASQLANAIEQTEKTGWVFKILENLAVNQPNQFERRSGENPLEDLFLARQN